MSVQIAVLVLVFYPLVLFWKYQEYPEAVSGMLGLMVFLSVALIGMVRSDAKSEATAEAEPELAYYRNYATKMGCPTYEKPRGAYEHPMGL